MAQLEKQGEKCKNETQKKTLDGIMRRRRNNLLIQNDKLLEAQRKIRAVEPFLRIQVWKEEADRRFGKGSMYTNRFTGEVRYSPPPSWWRLISCAKCIQSYYRNYAGRIIADHGACEVYPTLSPKYICYFYPAGSGQMRMSLLGAR